jgi:hypothetical protein
LTGRNSDTEAQIEKLAEFNIVIDALNTRLKSMKDKLKIETDQRIKCLLGLIDDFIDRLMDVEHQIRTLENIRFVE